MMMTSVNVNRNIDKRAEVTNREVIYWTFRRLIRDGGMSCPLRRSHLDINPFEIEVVLPREALSMFRHGTYSINIHEFTRKRKFISFRSLRDIILQGEFHSAWALMPSYQENHNIPFIFAYWCSILNYWL